ncbi:tyrosine-type recombinase/integrase [Lacrimispora sp. 38-1]|uniref:tyrosine-type recombinase/integrase n=1 Tax=Lacrimispora sp. 38-1 TaxID=3125778 RepID=UPI003CE934F6
MKKSTNEGVCLARHISFFVNDYVSSFLTESEHTIRAHKYTLTLYITYLYTIKGVTINKLNASCFNRSNIEDWILWLKNERNCCSETCNNRLACLRVFLKYLGSKEIDYLYLYHEATLIPRLKEPKTKVKGMSKNAVKALMSVPDATDKTGRRDLALIVLLYATACRIDEILSLKNKQIHLNMEKPYITIIGKGSKIRTIGLLPKAVSHLQKYMTEFHGNNPDPEAYVFYSRNTGIYGKLTQPAVGKMLKKHAVCAHEICDEVPINLHAHQIRHAKASHWIEDGMNIVQISLLLGHEHLQTTMVYLDITNDEKAAALATLDDETSQKVTPKWKNADASLLNLCGLS